jgi:hypothetical protein
MELRCPKCASAEVAPDPGGALDAQRCSACGARFPRDGTLISVFQAETHPREVVPQPLFGFKPQLAAVELRRLGGPLATVSWCSDADELHQLLDDAQGLGAITSANERARIYVYPSSLSSREPLIAVDPGNGPTLLGYELSLGERPGEDPISFTVRLLGDAVTDANALVTGRANDSARLDRIATLHERAPSLARRRCLRSRGRGS